MIVVEDYETDFKITCSDEDFYILKKGTSEKYVDAVDLKEAEYEYTETNEPIESGDTNAD